MSAFCGKGYMETGPAFLFFIFWAWNVLIVLLYIKLRDKIQKTNMNLKKIIVRCIIFLYLFMPVQVVKRNKDTCSC